eukprot:PhF_6_TR37809/c0_g1_i1/m.56293
MSDDYVPENSMSANWHRFAQLKALRQKLLEESATNSTMTPQDATTESEHTPAVGTRPAQTNFQSSEEKRAQGSAIVDSAAVAYEKALRVIKPSKQANNISPDDAAAALQAAALRETKKRERNERDRVKKAVRTSNADMSMFVNESNRRFNERLKREYELKGDS